MDANDFMGQAELVLKPEGEGDDELRIPAQTLALEDGGKKTEVPVQGTITLRLDDPTQDVVREVVVVSASGLKKADLLGGSDPYAVVLWDGQRVGQTHHVPNTTQSGRPPAPEITQCGTIGQHHEPGVSRRRRWPSVAVPGCHSSGS